MNYSKPNQLVEYLLFSGCYILAFFAAYFLVEFLGETVKDWIHILISLLLSLVVGVHPLFKLVSMFFFKLKIMGRLVPNFNGTWKGTGESSYDDTSFPVTIEIKQELAKISINAFFAKSKSEVKHCAVCKESDKEKLFYMYVNKPNNNSKLDMHNGMVILEKINHEELEGNYFTDRTEPTKGHLKLKRSNNSHPITPNPLLANLIVLEFLLVFS